MISIRRFLAFIATLWGGGAAVLLTATWMMAYASGGHFAVSVDLYGEATAELLMLFIVGPIFSVGLFYAVERYTA